MTVNPIATKCRRLWLISLDVAPLALSFGVDAANSGFKGEASSRRRSVCSGLGSRREQEIRSSSSVPLQPLSIVQNLAHEDSRRAQLTPSPTESRTDPLSVVNGISTH